MEVTEDSAVRDFLEILEVRPFHDILRFMFAVVVDSSLRVGVSHGVAT